MVEARLQVIATFLLPDVPMADDSSASQPGGKTRRYNSGSGSDRGRKEGEKQYSFDKATFRMAIKRTASIVKCGAAFVCREHFVLFTSRSDGDGETRRN